MFDTQDTGQTTEQITAEQVLEALQLTPVQKMAYQRLVQIEVDKKFNSELERQSEERFRQKLSENTKNTILENQTRLAESFKMLSQLFRENLPETIKLNKEVIAELKLMLQKLDDLTSTIANMYLKKGAKKN